jgi:hypothetical protein
MSVDVLGWSMVVRRWSLATPSFAFRDGLREFGANSLRQLGCKNGQQVLRLRSWIASRPSYCAQDDSDN